VKGAEIVSHLNVVDRPVENQVTIHTTLQIDSHWDKDTSNDPGEVVITGLATDPTAAQSGLFFTWSCKDQGWFRSWVLKLHSEAGWSASVVSDGRLHKMPVLMALLS
jgi:hypothetical protein